MVPLCPLFSLVASILFGMWLLCATAQWGHWLRIGAVSIVLPFHVIKGWVIDQVALMMFVCSFVCLHLSTKCIKSEWDWRYLSILFPSSHHYHHQSVNISSPRCRVRGFLGVYQVDRFLNLVVCLWISRLVDKSENWTINSTGGVGFRTFQLLDLLSSLKEGRCPSEVF